MLAFLQQKRREKLLKQPPSAFWTEIIQRNVPHSDLLSDAEWRQLLDKARILENEKRFEGAGGLELTQEMRVTIAAWGALLLLNRETEFYPALTTVVIYPSSFIVPVHRPVAEGASISESEVRTGESCATPGPGSLILAWDEVIKSAGDYSDGVNVAIHEFAHQLDLEDGLLNGTPQLSSDGARERWARVLNREYQDLVSEVAAGRDDMLLDPYGASSPVEFFAVAIEHFFEWARDFRAEKPELYEVLKDYLCQDPAQRWDVAEG